MQLRSGKVINNNSSLNEEVEDLNKYTMIKNYIDKMVNNIRYFTRNKNRKTELLDMIRLWAELFHYVSFYMEEIKEMDTEFIYINQLVLLGKEFIKFIDELINEHHLINDYIQPEKYDVLWNEFEYSYIYDTRVEVIDIVKNLKMNL